MRLGILGGGRAAWAYGTAWRRIGWPLAGVWLRSESKSRLPELLGVQRCTVEQLAAESELLLVAVSDSAIDSVVSAVPPSEAILFHASGALAAPARGFSLHPLRALPPVGEPSDLDNTLLVFQGEHRKTAKLIAVAVGARFAEVSAEQKPLYHAAAVFGANYVAAVLDISAELMKRAGISDVREDLVRLAGSAIENWKSHDDAGRFTGPAARGDEGTLARHVAAIGNDAQVAEIYKLLAAWITASRLATPK
ncbi:MAG TPA: DUF2520 domain-containing protein [Thermoanaerobaculia bacterium]|nr:DUF2520 domain-containing protein [Thermoanaerobaculia bacterium]